MKFHRIEDLILFEDDNIIAFNKPAMLTSEKDNAPGASSLADMAKRYNPEIRLCHRLDKETTGVILGAKNDEYYRSISMQFQKKAIQKTYHALIAEARSFDQYAIELPLSKKGSLRAVVDKREGKRAITIIDSLEIFKDYTLVKAQPLTGRFHQIRVHMASIGVPLVGDELYGGKPFFLSQVKRKYKTGKYEEEQAVMARTALHAYSLEFNYPNEEVFSVHAPYPKDMDITIKLLRKLNSIS